MSGVANSVFANYSRRIAKKSVFHYVPPKFQVVDSTVELGGIDALTNVLSKLRPQTWFLHSPAGSGKSTLATQLMLKLLDQDVACVLVNTSNLKHYSEVDTPHLLAKKIKPIEVDETLWNSRAKKKKGKIVLVIDGVNEIEREFSGRSQWDLVRTLLDGNHQFPVLATSRYLPEDLDDTERDVFQLSLRPFDDYHIQQYLSAHGLDQKLMLEQAEAAGMEGATRNPFLLSLIVKQYQGIDGGFRGQWPKSRAELLLRTLRSQKHLSRAQKKIKDYHGLSQEAVLSAMSLSLEAFSLDELPIRELVGLLKKVWEGEEESEVIEDFVHDFRNLGLVENSDGEGLCFIHESLVDFGLAFVSMKHNSEVPEFFSLIDGQFDTYLGDWVGLHPDPETAVKEVIFQVNRHRVPDKLIDVVLANRGLLGLETQSLLWQEIGRCLLSSRQVKIRVADRLGSLPKSVWREARRHGVLKPLGQNNSQLVTKVEKSLEDESFNGKVFIKLIRANHRDNKAEKKLQLSTKRRLFKNPVIAACIKAGDRLAAKTLSEMLHDNNIAHATRGSAATALGQIGDRAAVDALSKALLDTSARENIRGSAATALGQIGDRAAVDALSAALLDTSAREDIRGSAATALGQIGDKAAVDALSQALLDDSAREDIRGSAATALGQIGDRAAVDTLSQALLDGSAREDIRGSAATALGQIGDRAAVDILSQALLDVSARENIRGSAATALGQIGDRAAVKALSQALLDVNAEAWVRGSAGTALGQIGDRAAVEALSQALLDVNAEAWIRGSAATALGRIGDRVAVGALSEALLDESAPRGVRGSAATALGRIGDKVAVEELSKVLLDGGARENIRGSAATALGQIGDKAAVEALSKVLLDESAREDVRGSAGTALGQIGDRAAVEALSQALLDVNSEVSIRGAAGTALGQIGDKAAVEALSRALLDVNAEASIRGSAGTALGQIGDKAAVEALSKALLDVNAEASIRGSAGTALGQIGDRVAVEALSKVLREDVDSYVHGSVVVALKKIRSESALPILRIVAEDLSNPDVGSLAIDAYTYITGGVEDWILELAKKKLNKRLNGKIVEVVARYSRLDKEFSWLKQKARYDWDYICRTEAVRGLAVKKHLDDSLIRYLIDPDYVRKDGRLRDTDNGVKGQVGAEIIRHYDPNSPLSQCHMKLVIDMMADNINSHRSIITAALNSLQEMPVDKSELVLRYIRENLPVCDSFLLKDLDYHSTILESRKIRIDSLMSLKGRPERYLASFKDGLVPEQGMNLIEGQSIETKARNVSMKPVSEKRFNAVIITAIKSETRALVSELRSNDIPLLEVFEKNSRFYTPFEVPVNNGQSVQCAFIQAIRKGGQGAQSLMTDVLRDLSPELVVMVGVCGGIEERGVKLNDVIVVQQVFHYERSRVLDQKVEYQPQSYAFSPKFLGFFNMLESTGKLDDALSDSDIFTKDIAAGDKVLMSDSATLRDDILSISGDIYGIEMEGHGMLHAAWQNSAQAHVETAMIKAVSDFCNSDKNTDKEKRQLDAATCAARVVISTLQQSQALFKL